MSILIRLIVCLLAFILLALLIGLIFWNIVINPFLVILQFDLIYVVDKHHRIIPNAVLKQSTFRCIA